MFATNRGEEGVGLKFRFDRDVEWRSYFSSPFVLFGHEFLNSRKVSRVLPVRVGSVSKRGSPVTTARTIY